MGILFAFALWGTVLVVLATIASLVLLLITSWLTRGATSGLKIARGFSLVIPFATITIWAVGFLVYVSVNDAVFHRDAGLGDTWYTPIPNGYTLRAIDVEDEGELYQTDTQYKRNHTVHPSPTVEGVRRLQIDGPLIAGTYDSQYVTHFATDAKEDHYFILDTNSGQISEFPSIAVLNANLSQRGLQPHLRAFWEVLSAYHNTWFDWLIFAIAMSVPILGLFLLGWAIRRSRRSIPRPIPTAA